MTPVSGRTVPPGGGRRPLTPRDAEVVELVGRFRQLSAGQIRALVFGTQTSKTPLDRSLQRLLQGRYVARLDRLVGGLGGGSGQYVYQLGRAGWRLLGKGGAYRPQRQLSWHTLTIADCFVQLTALERNGRLAVLAFEPGTGLPPECGGHAADPGRLR